MKVELPWAIYQSWNHGNLVLAKHSNPKVFYFCIVQYLFQSHENEIQNTCNYYQYSNYVNYLLLVFNKAICICAFLSFSLLCRKVNCTPYKRRKTCIPVHAKANGRLRPYNFKRRLLWLLNKIMVQWLPAKNNCVWMMLFETGSRWVKGEIVPSPTVISISISWHFFGEIEFIRKYITRSVRIKTKKNIIRKVQ